MNKHPKILICDDDPIIHQSLSLYLDNEEFEHNYEKEEHQYCRIGAETFDEIIDKIKDCGDNIALIENVCDWKNNKDNGNNRSNCFYTFPEAFEKIFVQGGQTVTVKMRLDEDAFTYYNEQTHSWQTEQGEVSLQVCKNANEIVTEYLL